MKIESAAGEFEFDISAMELNGRDVVLVGKMGVWEARTCVPEDELTRLLSMLLRSGAFWKLVPRLPMLLFKALSTRPTAPVSENTHD